MLYTKMMTHLMNAFAATKSAEDSYRDHSDFLSTRPNYTFLFDINPEDYTDWAYGLRQARYATNPRYPQLLIKTIEDNNLEYYTDVALLRSQTLDVAEAPKSVQQTMAFENTSNIIAPKQQPRTGFSAALKPDYPEGVFSINNTKVVYVTAGTSVYALSKKYNVAYNKILQFNEMNDVPVLVTSQLVYLAKKPKKCDKEYHIVTGNESANDIAQAEGIQLESLLSYNNLQKDEALKSGDKIALQSSNTGGFFKKIARL